jgi:hypothetical protein
MYCMRTETLELQLEIVPVSSLVPHEEVIPDAANELVLEFSNWTHLQNPVIVDDNYMVLDGHHRFFVFKTLHFKYIPVCRINYLRESVQLRYWFRIFECTVGHDEIRTIIDSMQASLCRLPDKETLTTVLRRNPYCWGIQGSDSCDLVTCNNGTVCDAVSAYDALEEFQARLRERGVEIQYIACQSITEHDSDALPEPGQVIIWTPQITKDMVVEAVREGKKFPPKATRHLVPARPLHVDIPTLWLKEDISIDEINERFSELLKRKGVKRFGPGQVVNGRYYEEELFVFYDKDE